MPYDELIEKLIETVDKAKRKVAIQVSKNEYTFSSTFIDADILLTELKKLIEK